VLPGETHESAEHHRRQLQVLAALRVGDVIVAAGGSLVETRADVAR
jgi:hypothetical protein